MKLRKKTSRLIAIIMVFTMLLSTNVMAAYTETENGFLYNETTARSVTVTVTVSSDGVPILGNDRKETPMENLEVTVPYFDLAKYGLEGYYRYPAGDTGSYSKSEGVVKRPTGLHLYIYLLEKYYLGLDTNKCGTAYDLEGLFETVQATTVNNIWGDQAYNTGTNKALAKSGGACSLYMTNFWGHSENLLYFVNGEYPLWRRGSGAFEDPLIGATSDYILLEDGDRIDVAMFSNYDFCYNIKGGFLYFPQDSYTIRANDTIAVDQITRNYGFISIGFETRTFYDDLGIYDYYVKSPDGDVVKVADTDYTDGITFEGFDTVGTYYIYALDKAAGQNTSESEAISAPGVAKVVVTEAASGNVKVVLDAISAIGDVSYTDETKALIDAARAAYDALTEEEKNSILADELAVLTTAENTYTELEETKKAEEEAAKKAEEEAAKKAEEEAAKKAEEEAAKKAEEEAAKKAEEEAAKKAEEEAAKKAEEEAEKKAEEEAAKKAAEIEAVNETKITSLKAKKYKTTGIKLTWKKDSALDGYEVYRSTKKNSGYKLVKSVAAAGYTLNKGLSKSKTYYYKVRGYKLIDGEKAYTKETRICVNLNQTKAIKAIAITGAKATATKGKVTLTWDKHESMYSLKGYKIYKSTKKNSGYKQVKTTKTESVVIKSGLKSGKTYYFKIQGYAKVGKKTVTTKAKVIKVKAK